jgi:endonuclease/exonuclease/phosphatase family metal-dependent hydrolase
MFQLSPIFRWLLLLQLCSCVFWFIAWKGLVIEPLQHWWFSFLALGYLFFLIFSMLIGCVFLMSKKIYFLIPFVFLWFSYPATKSVFNINFFANENKSGALDLMTYNVKNFDLYDWNKGPNTRLKMLQLLRNERPTILCLQEFYSSDKKNKFNNEKYIADSLGYPFYQFNKMFVVDTTEAWGLAVFSRLPIVNEGLIKFKKARINGAMFVDIVFELDTFRVYNLHLQSFHFGNTDYALFENETQTADRLKDAKGMFSKLKFAFIERGKQVATIVCGDFNDSPISYSYHQLSKNKKDAFVEKGAGFGRTFNTKTFAYRIDHVLLDSVFKVKSYRVIPKKLSDHFPVVISFDY